jgi:hypothetical protein
MTANPAILANILCLSKSRERGLLFVADRPDGFAAAADIVAAIHARDSRLHVLATSTFAATRDRATQVLADVTAIPFIFGNAVLAGFNLRRLNIRVVVFMGACEQSASPAFLAALQREAIAIVSLAAPGETGSNPALAEAAEIVSSVAPSRGTSGHTVADLVDLLAAMMARDLKVRRKGGPGTRFAAGLIEAAPRSRMAGAILDRRCHRLRNIDELAAHLSKPKTIMCLGNGPSSEDPALASMPHDALFRVNHSWKSRGFLAKPDIVFCGGKPTMRAIDDAAFGLQTESAAVALVSNRLFSPSLRRAVYFNANDMTDSLRDFDWGHLRPTNGASMLATAMALAPERLIVAGIDLFSDPAGSYPGDTATENAYSPGHSRDRELAFLLALLDLYRGDLAIVGAVLNEEWRRHNAAKSGGNAPPPSQLHG